MRDELVKRALAKNLRGILCLENVLQINKDVFSFLIKVHRYRMLGAPGWIKELYKGKSVPKCLVILPEIVYPQDFLVASVEYMAPLIVIEENLWEKFSISPELSIYGKWPNSSEFLRHLRIAEYSMIDMILCKNSFHAKEDLQKRFWRLLRDNKKKAQTPLIAYLPVNDFYAIALSASF